MEYPRKFVTSYLRNCMILFPWLKGSINGTHFTSHLYITCVCPCTRVSRVCLSNKCTYVYMIYQCVYMIYTLINLISTFIYDIHWYTLYLYLFREYHLIYIHKVYQCLSYGNRKTVEPLRCSKKWNMSSIWKSIRPGWKEGLQRRGRGGGRVDFRAESLDEKVDCSKSVETRKRVQQRRRSLRKRSERDGPLWVGRSAEKNPFRRREVGCGGRKTGSFRGGGTVTVLGNEYCGKTTRGCYTIRDKVIRSLTLTHHLFRFRDGNTSTIRWPFFTLSLWY